MSLDPQAVYRKHPDAYHRLVLAEDCDGNLLRAVEAIADLDGANVLEVGAGTGRITRLLLERGARVEAFEKEPAMLQVAREHLTGIDSDRYRLEVADARELPVADGQADLAIAGWVFGHFRYWMPDDWRREISAAIDEMNRALVDGGIGIIVETLGTGVEQPAPPVGLEEYYQWLEGERGCTRTSLRTDYRFDDVAVAAETLSFFFGPAIGATIRSNGWARVPEFTGLWWWQT